MAPIEVRRELDAARLRQHDRRNEAVFLAWQVERIRLSTKRGKRSVRIVPLTKVLLPEPGAPTRQTPREMRGVLAQLSAQYRIPLRQVHG